MSWNVYGLKRKLGDIDFIELVNQNDITLFCETWLNENDCFNLDIPGYHAEHIFGKKSKHTKRGRFSGGISVYYKNELKNHIKLLETSCHGFIWLKIKKELLCFQEDVILGHVYFPGPNSKVSRQQGEEVDHFDLLENYILQYKNHGKLFISGDFNSRCGSENSDILCFDKYLDESENLFTDLPIRISKDHVLDAHGRNLLALCQTTDMCIANGRIESGEFTFSSHNGQSVVDYVLANFYDMHMIRKFEILPFNEFSHHAPLSLVFPAHRPAPHLEYEETDTKTVWNSEKAEMLLQNLRSKENIINELTSNLQLDSTEKSVQDLTALLQAEVSAVMSRKIKLNDNQIRKKKSNPWFDENCTMKRRQFITARNTYQNNKTDNNRTTFIRARTGYNRTKRKAKSKYKQKEGKRICALAKSKPRDFWANINKFVKSKKKSSETLTCEDFLAHFQSVLGENPDPCTQAQDTNNTGREGGGSRTVTDLIDPDLDGEIRPEEIRSVIASLKNAKSPGMDDLVAEIFKLTNELLSTYLVRLYNKIFLSGDYPESWSKGVIVPIYKNKGDIDSTNNYRGITLTNVLAKIFSHILLNRINKWSEKQEKINCNQFGFQKAKSTIDCIFILSSIISKVLNAGNGSKKLYCAFIDYEKAFDKVDRYLLWFKLLQEGISPRLLNILKSMYSNVKVCIKYRSRCSNFMQSDVGLKQGDPLSPILFMFFINDIVDCVNNAEMLDTVDIEELTLFILLYADDAVIFAKSAESLQSMLNDIQEYCNTWHLTINTNKTKIMVFERGRHTHPKISLNGTELEVVSSFKYLGVELFKNGNWSRTQKHISQHASYALFRLYNLFNQITLTIHEKLKLFDSLVGSILN